MNTNDSNVFEKNGCFLIKNFFEKNIVAIFSQYLENKINRGEWTQYDDITDYAYYADPLSEVFLLNKKQDLEKKLCKELLPTYSFVRVYQPGESLEDHVDRPSCEITVSVNIASVGPSSPLFMKYKDLPVFEYNLHPGDAVVYKGIEVRHWRHKFLKNQLNAQVMLHYVDKNNKYSCWEKDGRLAYGLPSDLDIIKKPDKFV